MNNKDRNEDFLNFLNRCIQKEKDAWNCFVENYNKLIYSYIIKTLKRYNLFFDNSEVYEIFSKVFLAILDKECHRLKIFQGVNERSFMAYLRVISFNITIDFLRARREFIEFDNIQYRIFIEDPYVKVDLRYLKDIILNIIRELPIRQKYLFDLIYREEMTHIEIAEIMNMKQNAVYQLKLRMMKNIKKILKKKDLYNELKLFSYQLVV